ncbi:MAG: SGNH/GDSL hydrolase family protein [Actinomycetota bacterium]
MDPSPGNEQRANMADRDDPRAGPPARRRRPGRLLLLILGVLVLVAASVSLALLVTPPQQVSVAGQTLGVGATGPSLSLSGPGELDMFGQHLPTVLQFSGPVRPRLVLSRITLKSQVTSLFQGGHAGDAQAAIGHQLANGWVRYFIWEAAIAAGFALLFSGALAGWRRSSRGKTVVLLIACVVLAEAVNVGGVMVTAYTAPARLREVRSLEALVGSAPLPTATTGTVSVPPQVQAVVLGDSTAAGDGNPLVSNPSDLDKACHRSGDSYANDLGVANGWQVENLACSGATVPAGLLGPQTLGSVTAPTQLSVAQETPSATVVAVSVGADDVAWSNILQACAVTPDCNNQASISYFQQQLATFTPQYFDLMSQLAALPWHPTVLINLYYNPFDPDRTCLDHVGLSSAKEKSLVGLLDALNAVLQNGAQAAGFIAVQPSFAGHALCDPDPYVQGLTDPAPFHPTAAGELAIALADEQALSSKG